MRHSLVIKSVLAVGLLAFLVLGVCPRPAAADPTAQATQVVAMLAKGDFAGVVKNFDDRMKKALPEAKLREAWKLVTDKAGSFKKQLKTRAEKVTQEGQQYDLVTVSCEFSKAPVDVKVVYNAAGQVAGLFFTNPQ
jgi:hypothetical protein